MNEIAWAETTGFVVCTTSNPIQYDTTETVMHSLSGSQLGLLLPYDSVPPDS